MATDSSAPPASDVDQTSSTTVQAPKLPRVAITYCTQCRWMLRAAYFGQELLSTFGTAIGEIALIPATGGIFQVHLTSVPLGDVSSASQQDGGRPQTVLLWDRKDEGGFPETKILKQRLRNHIEPGKDLGHSDKPSNKARKDVSDHSDHAGQKKEDCEECKSG